MRYGDSLRELLSEGIEAHYEYMLRCAALLTLGYLPRSPTRGVGLVPDPCTKRPSMAQREW